MIDDVELRKMLLAVIVNRHSADHRSSLRASSFKFALINFSHVFPRREICLVTVMVEFSSTRDRLGEIADNGRVSSGVFLLFPFFLDRVERETAVAGAGARFLPRENHFSNGPVGAGLRNHAKASTRVSRVPRDSIAAMR